MPPQNNQNPIVPPSPQQNNQKKPEPQVGGKMVETYAGDMAEVIEDNKGGIVKKIIHDEEAREAEKKNLSPESKKNQLFMVVGIVLIATAIGLLFFLFLNRRPSVVEVENHFTPMIFIDKTDFLEISDLTKDQTGSAFSNKVNTTEVESGGIEGIYLTKNKKVLGLRELISHLKGSLVLPGTNLVDDNFLLGAYVWETRSPFILIKIRSMQDIFESLRTWEGKMFYDLHGLFGININVDTNHLLTKNFSDSIIENKNARILYDQDGMVALMYVFVDDTHVVITRDEAAAHEVITRLAGVKIMK